VDPGVDESRFREQIPDPERLAERLAREKALAVAGRDHEDALVIGGDQLVAVDGRILGKPGSPERARDQLALLSGRAHRLVTAVAIVHRDLQLQHCDITTLYMRRLTPGEIERYVSRESPVECAGAYRIERGGIALFERIESADHTAIVGLPLIWVSQALRSLGIELP
jgi:septum formation protein